MSHGYNPAGNVSGGQWQAAYQQQGQAAQAAQQQQYAAPQSAPASGQGAGGYVQGGPQQYAGQQRSYDPAQAEYTKLKSTATFAIWMAFVAFIAAPVIFLLGDCVHAQRLCSRAQAINAPEDVMKRVKLARGICAGLLLLQVVLIVVVVIGANM